jgi:hypothetical protein
MERRSARPHQQPIAKDQALVVQRAEGASQGDAAGETPGIGENPAGKRRERKHVGVLAKDHSQHGPLHQEIGHRHRRTVRRKAAAGCST